MFKQKYFCGLDIGTQYLKAGIIKVCDGMTFELVDRAIYKTKGLHSQGVSELEELVECINHVVGSLAKKTKIKVKDLHVGIGAGLIYARNTNTAIPLTEKGNKVIAHRDIKKIKTHAQLLSVQMEEEILHSIDQNYSIDDTGISLNPGGLYARKLGLNSLMLLSNVNSLNNITQAVTQAGYDVANIFFNAYTAAEVVLNRSQMNKGVCLVDMGASGVNVLIFKEGHLCYFDRILCGGDSFTASIAQDLNFSFDLSEEIKKSYANVLDVTAYSNEEILVKKDQTYIPIKRGEIDGAMERNMKIFIAKIQESLEISGLGNEIDGGMIVIGGGAFLSGLIERLEKEMHLPIQLGVINLKGSYGAHETALFASAMGLAQHGFNNTLDLVNTCEEHMQWVKRIFQRVGELYEEYF